MTMTVDNAPSNDKAIGYLIKKLPNARLYDDGKHFHVRCMAHILNLIVQEGLKIAVELRDVFFKYELIDDCYYRDLDRVPERSDFGACKEIETKPDFCVMVHDMVDKYNKYWGKFYKLNDFMCFATILDPTMKQRLVSHGFKTMLMHKMSYEDTIDDDVLNDTKVKEAIIDDIDDILNDDDVAREIEDGINKKNGREKGKECAED
ncbi:zinc finger BED domain-containing protein RICESLEEPER 2 [Tanacetum coccineum]